jgi:hypothetical protein
MQPPSKETIKRLFRYIDYVISSPMYLTDKERKDRERYELRHKEHDRRYIATHDVEWLDEFLPLVEQSLPYPELLRDFNVIDFDPPLEEEEEPPQPAPPQPAPPQPVFRTARDIERAIIREARASATPEDMDYLRENDGTWFRMTHPMSLSDYRFRYMTYLRNGLRHFGMSEEEYRNSGDIERLRNDDREWFERTNRVHRRLERFYDHTMEEGERERYMAIHLENDEKWEDQFEEEMRKRDVYVRYRQGKMDDTELRLYKQRHLNEDEQHLRTNDKEWFDAIDRGMSKAARQRFAGYAETGRAYNVLSADIECLTRNGFDDWMEERIAEGAT